MTDKVTLEPTLTDDEVLDWLQEFFGEPLLTWNKLIEDVRYYAGCWVVNMDANNEALVSAQTRIEKLEKLIPKKMLFDEVFMERFHIYTSHKRGCSWDDSVKGDVCTCGLQALIHEYYEIKDVLAAQKEEDDRPEVE